MDGHVNKKVPRRSTPEQLAAKTALKELKSICRDPEQRAQDRIAAAKVLLEYGGIRADEDTELTVRVEGAPTEWLK
ncbi:MAG: hypothetical protein IJP37_03745 [Clostridia bacterium]|nr:hypothetical protein [Clostridia bacterium]